MPNNMFCMRNYAAEERNLLNLEKKYFNSISRVYSYLDAYEGKTDISRMFYQPKKAQMEVRVAFINLTKNHAFLVEVNSTTTVAEVMRKVGLSAGIKFFGDFGLFVKYSGVPRLLDADEYIFHVVANIQQ